jgi:CBS domain-containing protein
MSTARDIMHLGAECIGEDETLAAAAQKMWDLHVGALPICGQDMRLHGIITAATSSSIVSPPGKTRS